MAETITVTVPELPLIAQPTGDELIAVWNADRLSRIEQAALRGTRTNSGPTIPPSSPSEIMAMRPILGDRWRNTETGDEWKVTSFDPFTWEPDGNVKGADGVSNQPGPRGGPGERGAPGPSGRTLTKVAGEAISDWSAVILDENDRFRRANPNNPAHRQRVVGVVSSGAANTLLVDAQTAGDVKGPEGGFAPSSPLFVGANGVLTPNAPPSGWRQIVATAVTSRQVNVALGEARIVADDGDALIIPDGGFATAAAPADVQAASAQDRYLVPARLGDIAAPGNPVGDAIGSKVAAQNPALTGTSRLTGTGPTTDLITSIPANGTFTGAAGAGGAPFQAEPALGPFHGVSQDLTRAQTVRYFTPTGDSNKGEYGTLLNMITRTGFPTAWQPNTVYPEGGTCLNDGGKMYRVMWGTKGGTSAASGLGPTGTAASIPDGTITWNYEPNFTPGNGGKTNLCLMTYQEAQSGAAWTGAFAHRIASGGPKKTAYTLELDLTNDWGDYTTGPSGPGATVLQIFVEGAQISSAISIGQYAAPATGTSMVNGIVFGGANLIRDNTIVDFTGSINGYANIGTHPGSAFTDGSASAVSFNSYGNVGIGFRHSGTSAIGLKLEGIYTGFQVQGVGWNVNGAGALTATGVVTNNGFNFTTDATQDIGTASTRARNLYLANNPIVGSDQSLKTPLEAFSDKQLDAWGKVRLGLFQYLAAVEEKGEGGARIHAGVIAQQVVKALGKDAFRYGVVGRDLLTRTVTKTRKVSVPKTEPADVEEAVDAVEDGRAVRRVVIRTEQRPVFEHIPLWNEEGTPVMTRRVRTGADGKPVPTHLPEQNDDGETVMRPRPEAEVYEPIQATHPQPVMVEVDETYEAEEPDLDGAGKQRVLLNIRYDQLAIWEAAYQRRRADRIEARLAALEAARSAS
jgi:hypothetical protein